MIDFLKAFILIISECIFNCLKISLFYSNVWAVWFGQFLNKFSLWYFWIIASTLVYILIEFLKLRSMRLRSFEIMDYELNISESLSSDESSLVVLRVLCYFKYLRPLYYKIIISWNYEYFEVSSIESDSYYLLNNVWDILKSLLILF